MEKINYQQSGVNVREGYRAVEKYKIFAEKTKIAGQLSDLGSFGGAFAVPKGLKNPVLISGTDGVGTKLDIAFKMKKYDTVGIDCVAMSVNDILCSGARPLFFLDYVACGKLDSNVAAELVKGVAEGCVESGCALLGGETAEMPGFYDEGKYDLAGFAVGVAEKSQIITGSKLREGDVLIGLSSSGVHSNGFSLVRKLVSDFDEKITIDGKSTKIGEALLAPTRIYVKPVLKVLEEFPKSVHAMCHITGGGFYENIPRMFSKAKSSEKQLCAKIKNKSWQIPQIFSELILRGADENSLFSTFNMGIGFILAVAKKDCEQILQTINSFAQKTKIENLKNLRANEIGFVSHTEKIVTGDLKEDRLMVQFFD